MADENVVPDKIIKLHEVLTPNIGEFSNRYFKTVWNFQTPPYVKVPFFLKDYNPQTKKFTIVVLTDKRELNYIPTDYPCVPISEEEAQMLVEHRRNNLRTKTENNMAVQLSSSVQEAAKDSRTEGNPNPTPGDPTAPKVDKKRGRGSNDGRTSIRQLVLAGISENKSQDEIVAAVKAVYPEREDKNIKGLIGVVKHSLKAKAAKADETPA